MSETTNNTVIYIKPDGPARLAQRLVRRLQRDGLLNVDLAGARRGVRGEQFLAQVTEALADEIHQDTLDNTLRCSR